MSEKAPQSNSNLAQAELALSEELNRVQNDLLMNPPEQDHSYVGAVLSEEFDYAEGLAQSAHNEYNTQLNIEKDNVDDMDTLELAKYVVDTKYNDEFTALDKYTDDEREGFTGYVSDALEAKYRAYATKVSSQAEYGDDYAFGRAYDKIKDQVESFQSEYKNETYANANADADTNTAKQVTTEAKNENAPDFAAINANAINPLLFNMGSKISVGTGTSREAAPQATKDSAPLKNVAPGSYKLDSVLEKANEADAKINQEKLSKTREEAKAKLNIELEAAKKEAAKEKAEANMDRIIEQYGIRKDGTIPYVGNNHIKDLNQYKVIAAGESKNGKTDLFVVNRVILNKETKQKETIEELWTAKQLLKHFKGSDDRMRHGEYVDVNGKDVAETGEDEVDRHGADMRDALRRDMFKQEKKANKVPLRERISRVAGRIRNLPGMGKERVSKRAARTAAGLGVHAVGATSGASEQNTAEFARLSRDANDRNRIVVQPTPSTPNIMDQFKGEKLEPITIPEADIPEDIRQALIADFEAAEAAEKAEADHEDAVTQVLPRA